MAISKRRRPRLKKVDKIKENATTEVVVEEVKEEHVPKKASKELLQTQLGLVRQLDKIKQEKKALEKRESELKDQLRSFVMDYGARNDRGSFNIVLGDKVVSNTRRITSKLNQDKAVEVFKNLGLLKEVSEVKSVVVEELVEQLILQEKVPKDILDDIMDVKESFAFTLNDYKEEDEDIDATK